MYDTEDTASLGDDLNVMTLCVMYEDRADTLDIHVDDDWHERMDERAEDLTWMVFTLGAASWCIVVLLFTIACALFGTWIAAVALIAMVVVEFNLMVPILDRMLNFAELWRKRDVRRVTE